MSFQGSPDYATLARVLREPSHLRRLSPEDLSRFLDAANVARLLGWAVTECRAGQIAKRAPAWLQDRLRAADAQAASYERAIRWEIDRLARAFYGTGQRWILLKGAGYVAAGLAPGAGRRVADIDILVPRSDLTRVEELLHDHGWELPQLDPYDERYYREWMHELPPMVHRERQTIVDVHHAILPGTSRLHPASERLLERAVTAGDVHVLCPSHMVLHAAAHLFHDGEIAGAIRDLVDIDQLLRCFGRDGPFWEDFIGEARTLDLTRPAYYAVTYARRWFATSVPDWVVRELQSWAPPAPVGRLMEALVARSIATTSGRSSSFAVFALYVRSHWLRMPPLRVIAHLSRKALRRR
ncbi:MAG TPA: nucleotidyltransferase family protein [Vicinamibacterales bacterium]|nr:nucleotidyltransferase family protein [Vicinamibacterales bacterium]